MRKTILLLSIMLVATTASGQTLKASIERATVKPVKIEQSQWKPFGPMTKVSSAVCFAGAGFDVATSGPNERNPLLRRADGSINKPLALGVGLGTCGATLAVEHFWPKASKAMSITRFLIGGIHFGVAAHNRFGVIQ